MDSLSAMNHQLWIISLLLSPDGFSLCDESSTVDYLAAVCFPLMDSLSAMNHQLWITSLLFSPDGFSLFDESSTVDYLTAVCFPLDRFSLCHNNYQLWITLLQAAFHWWIYCVPWIISCHLCRGVSAVVCSWIMDYLLSTALAMVNDNYEASFVSGKTSNLHYMALHSITKGKCWNVLWCTDHRDN